MQSRLLNSLFQQARDSSDRDSWAKAVCRSASHYGRQGHTDRALEAIGAVRAEYGNDLTATAASWLWLAEGILHFFQNRWSESHDRIRRAYALSFAMQVVDAQPSCAAWMAHCHFNALRFPQMAETLEQALRLARSDDHQALARASLVLADAVHFAGSFQRARPWYDRARLHATAEGDESTLSALMHNLAAFRTGNVRIANAFSEASLVETKHALMQANSAWNFDTAIGTASLTTLLPLLQGQTLTVLHRFVEAERMFRSIDQAALEDKSLPLLLVDLAWCVASLGRQGEADALARKAQDLVVPTTDIDEVAFINARLAQIAERGQRLEDAKAHWQVGEAALSKHRDQQAALLLLLEPLITAPNER